MTPFIAVCGRHPNAGWSFLEARTNDEDSLGAFITRMQTTTQKALRALFKARERHNTLVNLKRLPLQFKVGDKVYVKTTKLRSSMKGVQRFKPRWIDPVSITRQLGTSLELDLSSYPSLAHVQPVFHSTLLQASKAWPAKEDSFPSKEGKSETPISLPKRVMHERIRFESELHRRCIPLGWENLGVLSRASMRLSNPFFVIRTFINE